MDLRGGGRGLQPPQNFGQLRLFGQQEKFGQSQFLKMFSSFFVEKKIFSTLPEVGIVSTFELA